jgi:hypothetical protein
MFNVNWGLISGGAALVLAFVTSLLLGHTTLLIALLRAGIFAAVFFGLGTGISALVNIFIPELLPSGAKANAADNVFSAGGAGSRINITLDDDTANAALPDSGGAASNTDEVGSFNDLISGAIQSQSARDIDQNPPTGYTVNDNKGEFAPAFDDGKIGDLGDFSMDFGAFVSDGDGMASTESDLDSFSLFPETDGFGVTEESSLPERKVSGNKPTEFKGDFNPKEIAAGIRTVLEKDKKG